MVVSEDYRLKSHLKRVIRAMGNGQLVFFLGADINLCGRPKDVNGHLIPWQPGKYPPSNQELAIYLDEAAGFCYREKLRCPLCDAQDVKSLPVGCPIRKGAITKMALQQVSQHIIADETSGGPDVLYGNFYDLFQGKFLETPVHQFLAQFPKLMRQKGCAPPYPLIVSTCFDRTLEQAFDTANQPYDLISYVGELQGGYFTHQAPGSPSPHRIRNTNQYGKPLLERCPVILKLYGGYEGDPILTEDHYIDYLAHRDINELIPAKLLATLKDHHILFLGYSPSYWNLRVILHRLWPEQMVGRQNINWWAVQAHPEGIDQAFWKRYHSLPVVVPSLEDYIKELDQRVRKIPSRTQESLLEAGQTHVSYRGTTAQTRDQVFISYADPDQHWLEELKTTLKPAVRDQNLVVWDKTLIEPGVEWRAAIKKALARAKVAVLLVSKNYLAEDFIQNAEFPVLLEAAVKEGLTILWIYVGACLYEVTDFNDYQPAYDKSKPLSELTPAAQERALTQIGKTIIAAMQG
jgi:hypothetical protein